jgi:MFS family permease
MIKNISSFIQNKSALSVGFLFSVSSLLFGTWVAAIPSIKNRLQFTDGSLGLSLLLSPLGAITGMLLSRFIFRKLAVGKWMLAGYIISSIIMILLINAVNRPMLWVCLYFFGVFGFLNGVSTNATVNLLEKKFNRLMMSTCHGMYSLGGAVSALLASAFFAAGITSGWQIQIIALIVISIIVINRKYLLINQDIIHTKSAFKFPSPSILGISFICMVTFMAEGCVADWSALYFKEVLDTPRRYMSFGYAGFSIAMTIGRLNGDSFIAKVGGKKIVIVGSLMASVGFLMVSFAPGVVVAVTGYTLVGLGCSCIVPVLFSASANIPGVSTVEGLSLIHISEPTRPEE